MVVACSIRGLAHTSSTAVELHVASRFWVKNTKPPHPFLCKSTWGPELRRRASVRRNVNGVHSGAARDPSQEEA